MQLRWCSISIILVAAIGSALYWSMHNDQQPEPKDIVVVPAVARDQEAAVPQAKFLDVTSASGIRFAHANGAYGKKLLPETLGSGAAFFDFDNDGHPDLFFVNSRNWPGSAEPDQALPTQSLYRNRGDGTFEDVTKSAGLDVALYGMGVAVGDFDNDGWIDLFITGVGGNRLFRNMPGEGKSRRFVEVTDRAGDLRDSHNWPSEIKTRDEFLKHAEVLSLPSSAAFLDYDCDGLLDLFVCNYVSWSPKADLEQSFTVSGHGRTYGPPRYFKGTHCTLYRNMGNGVFRNVTAKAGIQVVGELGDPAGKSLGVSVADVDGDGWPDIFVANDTVRNFFFRNRGDGTFEEKGQEVGVAYAEGVARGAMGIDWGEYRPGKFAAVIGNFANEPNTLLRLDHPKQLLFSDAALIEGLAGPSRIVLRFGLFFFDYDLDGRLDLLTCNGHLEPSIQDIQQGQSYRQPVQLYWNTGGKRAFELVTAKAAGPDLFVPMVGRGCAFADIDGDGDLDVVLTQNGGPARLLRNDQKQNHAWVRFILEGNGKDTNRSALGAQVRLVAGGRVQHREVSASRGYLSQSELAVTFGLGEQTEVERVEIRWPNRARSMQVIERPSLRKTHLVRQAP